MVYTILQPAGRLCSGAAAANFRTADYNAAGHVSGGAYGAWAPNQNVKNFLFCFIIFVDPGPRWDLRTHAPTHHHT